jgi:hypothetical protein
MDAEHIRDLVVAQIDGAWDTINHHGVGLREALVPPRKITVIERWVRDGEVEERTAQVWVVLVERPGSEEGYRIVAKEDGSAFALASEGFAHDQHLVVSGWYSDFMAAFVGM